MLVIQLCSSSSIWLWFKAHMANDKITSLKHTWFHDIVIEWARMEYAWPLIFIGTSTICSGIVRKFAAVERHMIKNQISKIPTEYSNRRIVHPWSHDDSQYLATCYATDHAQQYAHNQCRQQICIV